VARAARPCLARISEPRSHEGTKKLSRAFKTLRGFVPSWLKIIGARRGRHRSH
jgi:hypothetical protein